ncbi:MAG TPA: hypothetical protein VIX38_01570 [Nitrososphaeraceae archaeon]|jgi:hypothetical protein
MSDRVPDWEATVHKTVRSSEGNLIGNVDAVDRYSVFVSTEGGRTNYKLPKHVVEGYDGHEVTLNVQKTELERYKDLAGEGFRKVK